MHGTTFEFVVAGIGLAVIVAAIPLAYDPATASATTSALAGLLQPIGAIVGLVLLLAAAGAFVTWFSGGTF